MVRKAFLLLLLFVFWAIVFLPLVSGHLGEGSFALFPAQSNPADRLPEPWDGEEPATVQVRMPGSVQQGNAPAAETCGDTYTIQPGDSLGKIAQHCGLTLADLLSANPELQNPNYIHTGQILSLANNTARGGADPLSALPILPGVVAAQPGAALEVYVEGMPPGEAVRVGIGLSGSGYHPLATGLVDAAGNLNLVVVVPAEARGGDEAFILVTTQTLPTRQYISEAFRIGH